MTPQTRYTRARDGHLLAWTTLGDGPRDLLYVPQSISAMEHLWEHPMVAAFFDRLATFARLIIFDRRGSGMSERLERPAPLEDQVDDIHAVMDAAGSERAAVMAIYEGGPMAMLFAATAPERVSALMLYAAMARTTWAEDYSFALTREVRSQVIAPMQEHWGTGEVLSAQWAPNYQHDRRLGAWLSRLQRLAMDPAYASRMIAANGALDVRPVLPSIQAPTLVLHRRDDIGFDFRHAEHLAAHIPGARLVALEGEDSLPFLGDSEAVLGEIEEFLTGARAEREPDRILATVLFTDICRSTERAAELGDTRWRALLGEHDRLVAAQVARHRGRVVKSMGDGVLAIFDGPARAIRAAHAIGEDVRGLGLEVRAGLHTGECDVTHPPEDVGGLAVHIAARVMAAAGPGEVVVSNTVKDLVVGSGLAFEDRGEQELRGVPGAWRLWAVA